MPSDIVGERIRSSPPKVEETKGHHRDRIPVLGFTGASRRRFTRKII